MSGFFDFLSDPQLLNGIGTGLQAYGQLRSGEDQQQFGQASKAALDFQAAQLREQANSQQAAGQVQAFQDARKAKIVASDALAAAAASGGGARDPTVVNVIAGIAQQGAYRRALDLYQGDDRARLLRLQAQGKEIEGQSRLDSADSQANGSFLSAGTSLLKGYAKDASLYQRFGNGGPQLGLDN